jgi:peroxiredoxin Q/BCP
MLNAGDRVPEFQLPVHNGRSVSSAELAGKRYLLYFYPKDDTPGCTVEACSFRDNLPAFENVGLAVFGVSADDAMSHQRFARKHGLNFPLIADPNHHLIGPMGVWVEKSMYGKKYMGIQRSTFLVDADGVIEKVWESVKPLTHTAEVLEYLGENVRVRKPAMVEAVKAAVGMMAKAAVDSVSARMASPVTSAAPVAAPKKAAPKKAAPKKAAPKKAAPKKAAPKKAAPKKAAPNKAAPKKAAPKKAAPKKAAPKKAAPKKAAPKKAAPKKAAPKKPLHKR